MDYSFGAARELYARREHPRVLLGTADLPRLRQILSEGDGRTVIAEVRRRVREAARRVLACPDQEALLALLRTPAGSELVLTGITLPIVDAALVALLDDDAEAREAVRRVLAAVPIIDGDPGRPHLSYRFGGTGYLGLAYDLVHAHLSPQERRAYSRWVYERGVRQTLDGMLPSFYHNAAQNVPLDGVLSQALALLALDPGDGLPDLAADWTVALTMLEAGLFVLVGPQGYPEEDMGYGTLMMARMAHVLELLRRAGIYDAYTQCPRYARFGDAMLHLVQPWGTHLSTTGDHGDDFEKRTFVLARLAQETHNPALLWLLTHLRDRHDGIDVLLREGERADCTAFTVLVADQFRRAVPPSVTNPPTAFCDTQRGMVTFRSGWDADATYVAFDGSQRSPAAQGHAHASCGHFMLSAAGDYFAVGPGRYNMEQDQHNVVLIDGKSGRSTNGEWVAVSHAGVLTGCHPGEFVDSASVDSSLQHNCYWARRTLALVKGSGAQAYAWVVDDINKCNDWAEYSWQLHTSPENEIALGDASATVTGWRRGSLLDVHFALPAPEEYPRPHRLLRLAADEAQTSSGNYVASFQKGAMMGFARPADMLHHSTFVRPRLTAVVAGLNGRFMSLLLPRAAGEAPATVARLASLPASLAVRVTFDRVEDVIIFAHEHHVLEAADVRARGRWCVVRRDRVRGDVLHYAVAEGTRLTVAGRPLPLPGAARQPASTA